MTVDYKKVLERDIDFLIIEEFVCNPNFAKVFLDKIGKSGNYTVLSAAHSLSDENGESDVTVIIEQNGIKHGILIEDKIDAVTMQEQSTRYTVRGDIGIEGGKYESYSVFLCAPAEYIREHKNDKNAQYPNTVSYEELITILKADHTTRSMLKAEMLAFAVKEKRHGYIVDINAAVTTFWRDSVAYLKDCYPKLHIRSADKEKGPAAVWFDFEIPLKNVDLVYKSDKGFVDLQFSGYGERIGELKEKLSAVIAENMVLAKAGKSASLRLQSSDWIVDFKSEFRDNLTAMEQVFNAVQKMYDISGRLNASELYPKS